MHSNLVLKDGMKRFISAIDAFTSRAGKGVAWLGLPLIGVLLYEIVSRYIFNSPTMWAHEASRFLFGVYTILFGAYVLLHDRHVRVDVIRGRLSTRAQAILDVATCVLSFTFTIALLGSAIPWAWRSFQLREVNDTAWAPPIYPFKIILVVGVAWLLLQLVVKLVRDLYIIRGTR